MNQQKSPLSPEDEERVAHLRSLSLNTLGKRFTDVRLDSIVPRNKKQSDLIKLLIDKPDTSVFLYGDTGTGKSHIFAGIFNYWLAKGHKRVQFLDDKTLKDEVRAAELEGSHGHLLKQYAEKEHFFWEEAGKVTMSEFHRMSLHFLIDRLFYRDYKHIFITSNFSLSELGDENYWGKFIARRLEDVCSIVKF